MRIKVLKWWTSDGRIVLDAVDLDGEQLSALSSPYGSYRAQRPLPELHRHMKMVFPRGTYRADIETARQSMKMLVELQIEERKAERAQHDRAERMHSDAVMASLQPGSGAPLWFEDIERRVRASGVASGAAYEYERYAHTGRIEKKE